MKQPLRCIGLAVLTCFLLAAPAGAESVASKYITVDIPDNWKIIMAPADPQEAGTIIISNSAGSTSIGFVSGPSGGASSKTVAELFANHFKAVAPPVERNGRYVFNFLQQQTPCQTWVAATEDVFIVTSVFGDRRIGLNFIKKHVKSEEFDALLPK